MWSEFSAPDSQSWQALWQKEVAGKTVEQLSRRSWEGLTYPAIAPPATPTPLAARATTLQDPEQLARGPYGLGALTALGKPAIEIDLAQFLHHQGRSVLIECLGEAEIRFTSASLVGSGADAVHELGWMLSGLIHLLQGLPEGSPTPLGIRLVAGPRLLLETAKFRAARRLLQEIEQAFELKAPLGLHLIQDERYLTLQDPHNNLLRSTTAALAALLAGADTCQLLPEGDRWASNVFHLAWAEAGLEGALDPVAGSGCIESLTRQLAEQAWQLALQPFDATTAWSQAVQQRASMEAALRRDEAVLVGVNRYVAGPAPERAPSSSWTPQTPVSLEHAQGILARGGSLDETGRLPKLPELRWAEVFESLSRRGRGRSLAVVVRDANPAKQDFIRQWLGQADLHPEWVDQPPSQGPWMLCAEECSGEPPLWAGKAPDGYAGIAVHRGCDRVTALEKLLEILP